MYMFKSLVRRCARADLAHQVMMAQRSHAALVVEIRLASMPPKIVRLDGVSDVTKVRQRQDLCTLAWQDIEISDDDFLHVYTQALDAATKRVLFKKHDPDLTE